jgi:putative ABC transport system permease protein
VVGEFALALTLLAGAGMAIHSFWNLYHIDTGVETDHTLTFILPMSRVGTTSEQSLGYYQQVIRRIQSAPGVRSASASTGLPLEGTFFRVPFNITGQAEFADPSKRPNVGLSRVTPDYLKTFGIRLVEGRFFTEADNATSLHVAVVNELFAKHYLAGKDPIGQVVNIPSMTPGSTPTMLRTSPFQPWVIVGVFHDVHGGMLQTQYEEIDLPFYQDSFPVAAVGVRTAQDPEAMKKSISAAVHSIDPTVPLDQVVTLDEIRDKQLVGQRFILFLYIGFAVLALTLAAVGIYGVMAFSVGQREHEIGVRMALGAGRDRVVSMVMREGAMLACVGSLLGLGGAYVVGRAIRTTLYDVGAFDLPAFSAVAAVLLIAALAACFIPARRAASIEPMQALRNE